MISDVDVNPGLRHVPGDVVPSPEAACQYFNESRHNFTTLVGQYWTYPEGGYVCVWGGGLLTALAVRLVGLRQIPESIPVPKSMQQHSQPETDIGMWPKLQPHKILGQFWARHTFFYFAYFVS